MAVTFDESVVVTGEPQLEIDIGGTARLATFGHSGRIYPSVLSIARETEPSVVIFGYTVQEGDEDTDGISVSADKITLNGGTIQDEAGNDAILTHEAVEPHIGHLVDGVRPTFASATTSNDGATVTITLTENIQVSPMLQSFIDAYGITEEIYQFIVSVLNVEVNNTWPTQTGAIISGDTVEVTMDTPVDSDDNVKVRYDGLYAKHTPAVLMDTAGNAMANFALKDATNNSTETDSSGAGNVWLSERELTLSRSNPGPDQGHHRYSVGLRSQPSGAVTVTLTSNALEHVVINPTTLTFDADNWDRDQDVRIRASDGLGYDSWVTITHTASGTDYWGEDSLKVLIQE